MLHGCWVSVATLSKRQDWTYCLAVEHDFEFASLHRQGSRMGSKAGTVISWGRNQAVLPAELSGQTGSPVWLCRWPELLSGIFTQTPL